MKKYEITTQEVGDYPIEEYGEESTVIIEAENTEDLIDKLEWDVDDSHERIEWSNKVIVRCIEEGYTCFYRLDEECFDDELYIYDGKNADGIRIDIEIVE